MKTGKMIEPPYRVKNREALVCATFGGAAGPRRGKRRAAAAQLSPAMSNLRGLVKALNHHSAHLQVAAARRLAEAAGGDGLEAAAAKLLACVDAVAGAISTKALPFLTKVSERFNLSCTWDGCAC